MGQASLLRFYPYLTVLIIALPMFIHGPAVGHDYPLGMVRTAEYVNAWSDGQWLPFWADRLYAGFGSPIFLFYPPLISALAGAWSILFDSVSSGLIAAILSLLLVGVYSVKSCVQALLPDSPHAESAARIASYAFALSPYLLFDLSQRNAYAEFAALCIAPIAFWGMGILGRERRFGSLLIALGLALTILAHNITALVVLALLITGCIVLYCPRNCGLMLRWGGLGITAGLALSAFYWLPALVLKPLVQSTNLLSGHFDFHANFAEPAELIGYPERFASGYLLPLIMGLSAWRVADWWGQSTSGRFGLFALATALLMVFMQTPPSTPLWETLPYLVYFQFPWRLMGPLSLMAAFLTALLVHEILVRTGAGKWLEYAIFALILANGLPGYFPYPNALPEDMPANVRHDFNKRIATATVVDEYLPQGATWATTNRVKTPVPVVMEPYPGDGVSVASASGTRIELAVVASETRQIRLARWYFPGWRAEADGIPLSVTPNALGTFDVLVPAGRWHVVILLEAPPIRDRALWISLLGLCLFMGIAIWRMVDQGRTGKQP